MKNLLFVAVIIFCFNSIINGQVVGKIFSKTEADSLYGEVLESYEIETAELENLLSMCEEYIMFRLDDGELHILDGRRNILRSTKDYIDDNVVFKYYSTSKVYELIMTGGEETTHFENRNEVVSLTNGLTTLEMALGCPPRCNKNADIYSFNFN